jgi:hypothetical protein
MKLRLALVGLAVAAAIIVAGCINYDQEMTLNADGSGTIMVHYTSDDPEGTQAPKLSFTEGDITGEYAKSNVTVRDIEVVVPAEGETGSHEATYYLDFVNVTDLNGYGVFAIEDKMTQVFALADAGDTAVFNQTCTLTMDVEDTSGLTDYKFTYSLTCPGAVTDHNGTLAADGNTVTWEYPLPDLINNTVEMNATYEKPAGAPGVGGLAIFGTIGGIIAIIICVIIIIVIIIIIIVLLKKKGKKGPGPTPTPPPVG